MGADYAMRSAVTQALWKYIKENDLQNPKDRRQIVCDAKLEPIFKRKSVNMFTMAKLLAPMMKNVESLQETTQIGTESEESPEDEARPASKRSTPEERLDYYAKPKPKVRSRRKSSSHFPWRFLFLMDSGWHCRQRRKPSRQ